MMNNPNLTGISIQNLTTTIDLNPQPQMSRLNGMNYVLAPEPPSYSSLYPNLSTRLPLYTCRGSILTRNIATYSNAVMPAQNCQNVGFTNTTTTNGIGFYNESENNLTRSRSNSFPRLSKRTAENRFSANSPGVQETRHPTTPENLENQYNQHSYVNAFVSAAYPQQPTSQPINYVNDPNQYNNFYQYNGHGFQNPNGLRQNGHGFVQIQNGNYPFVQTNPRSFGIQQNNGNSSTFQPAGNFGHTNVPMDGFYYPMMAQNNFNMAAPAENAWPAPAPVNASSNYGFGINSIPFSYEYQNSYPNMNFSSSSSSEEVYPSSGEDSTTEEVNSSSGDEQGQDVQMATVEQENNIQFAPEQRAPEELINGIMNSENNQLNQLTTIGSYSMLMARQDFQALQGQRRSYHQISQSLPEYSGNSVEPPFKRAKPSAWNEFEHNGRDAGAIEEQVISNVRIEQRSYSAVVWKPEPTMMNK